MRGGERSCRRTPWEFAERYREDAPMESIGVNAHRERRLLQKPERGKSARLKAASTKAKALKPLTLSSPAS